MTAPPSTHFTGVAPAVPHLANLPFASLQRVGLAGTFSGHFTNFPLASRQGAALAGVTASDAKETARNTVFSIGFSSPSNQDGRSLLRRCRLDKIDPRITDRGFAALSPLKAEEPGAVIHDDARE